MDPLCTEGLSLRHLPDLSDASFQIPVAASRSGDLLLAETDVDFFRAIDTSLDTPGPPRAKHVHEPLTLSELTPVPRHVISVSVAAASAQPLSIFGRPSDSTDPRPFGDGLADRIPKKLHEKPKPRTKVSRASGTGRFESLRSQINSLVDIEPVQSDTRRSPGPARPAIPHDSDRTHHVLIQDKQVCSHLILIHINH